MRWRAACVDILRALSNAQPNRALNGNDRADRGRVAVVVTAPRIPDTRPVERVGCTDAPSWGGPDDLMVAAPSDAPTSQ